MLWGALWLCVSVPLLYTVWSWYPLQPSNTVRLLACVVLCAWAYVCWWLWRESRRP